MTKKIQSKEEAIETVILGNKEAFNRIYSFAEIWVRTQFKLFSSDDLKEAYYLAGNPIPTQPSVFGGVFNTLAIRELIFHHGFTKSKHKIAHGRDLKTWISREYKIRQKNNSSNKSTLKLEL